MATKFRALIFANQGLGDTIMMLPALIDFLKEKENLELHIIVKDSLSKKFLKLFLPPTTKFYERGVSKNKIKNIYTHLRIVLKLWPIKMEIIYAPIITNSWYYTILLQLLNGRIKKVPKYEKFSCFKETFLPLESSGLHQVNFYQKTLNDHYNFKPLHEYIPMDECEKQETICISVGCGLLERHKYVSKEWIVKLIEKLLVKFPRHKILIFGGGERDERIFRTVKQVINPNLHKRIDHILNKPFSEQIKILQSSEIIITGSTGPGHLASLTSTPIICLTSPTNVFESGPYTDKLISINNYNRLECSPCYQNGLSKGCGKINCMELIDIKPVINVVNKIIRNETIDYIQLSKNHLKTIELNTINEIWG